MVCSSLNNQYYRTGVGALHSLGKIEIRQSIRTYGWGVLSYTKVILLTAHIK